MAGAVDPAFWTTRPRFGAAGGPLEHVLTDAGRALAFAVGSRVRRGQPAEALLALAAAGGAGELSERIPGTARIRPTALGRFDQVAWGYLKNAGLVESTGLEGIRLTDAGRAAIGRGHEERRSLLERVRLAHAAAIEERS